MENSSGFANHTEFSKIWLPFLLILIGIVFAFIGLIYVIITYQNLYNFSNSKSLSLILVITYSMASPLIVAGVAFLLLILIEPKKGAVACSLWIFLGGSVLSLVGSLLSIALQYEFLYNENPSYDYWIDLSMAAVIIGILGTIFCAVAGLVLVRAYLKGQVRAKHSGAS